MISLISPFRAQQELAENTRKRRLQLNLTQEGLAKRAGVSLPTLRKFEQKGVISLESFLRLQMVLGGLQSLIEATRPVVEEYSSIDEVLQESRTTLRKRGKRK